MNRSIQKIHHLELIDFAENLGDEILFLEMVGSVKEMRKRIAPYLKVLGINRGLRVQIKKELPWLNSLILSVPGQRNVVTIGYKMGFFVNTKNDDPKLYESIKKLLKKPPGEFSLSPTC